MNCIIIILAFFLGPLPPAASPQNNNNNNKNLYPHSMFCSMRIIKKSVVCSHLCCTFLNPFSVDVSDIFKPFLKCECKADGSGLLVITIFLPLTGPC